MSDVIAAKLPYPGGFPVFLSRYVIFGGSKKRVAMHFFNASEIEISGLRFYLVEKDEKGRELTVRPLERNGLSAERGTEFAVADVAVGRGCTAVEVRMESVLSGAYEYVFEEEGVSLRYGAKERSKEVGFRHKPSYSVSKRSDKYILAAFGLLLGLAVAVLGISWWFGFFKQAQPRGETAVAERSITAYVEA